MRRPCNTEFYTVFSNRKMSLKDAGKNGSEGSFLSLF